MRGGFLLRARARRAGAPPAFRRTRSKPRSTCTATCAMRSCPLGQHQRLLEVLKAAERLAKEIGDERRQAQIYSFLSNYLRQRRAFRPRAGGGRALARPGRTRRRHRPAARRQHERRRNLPDARRLSEGAELPGARRGADRSRHRDTSTPGRSACRRCGRAAISRGRSPSWATFRCAPWSRPRRCASRMRRTIRTALCHGVWDWAARACGRANSTRRSACSRADSRERAGAVAAAADRGRPGSRVRAVRAHRGRTVASRRRRRRRDEDGPLQPAAAACSSSAAKFTCWQANPTKRRAWRPPRCGSRPSRRSAATRSTRRYLLAEISAQRSGASAEAEQHYVDAVALATTLGMRPLEAHGHAGLARLHAKGERLREGAAPPHHRDGDVPRDGDVVLAGAT